MAFTQGVAASFSDLLGALRSACLEAGWNASDNDLHREGCVVRLTADASQLVARAATGLSGSTLQEAAPTTVRIASIGSLLTIEFPCEYNISIHGNPDEVFLHVRATVDSWQWIAFGRNHIEVPGAGVWIAASAHTSSTPDRIAISPTWGATSSTSSNQLVPAPFYDAENASSMIHVGVDGLGWAQTSRLFNNAGVVNAGRALEGLMQRSPSQMNGAAILLPVQVWLRRPGNTISLVAELAHVRLLRIDSYAAGEVISYGSDRWKVYPFFRKNVAQRDGGSNIAHTGTMGMAVRHDGP